MTEDRLARIEEDAAFTARSVEELSRELFETNKRLDTALARIESLERRLREVGDRVGADCIPSAADQQRPPHSVDNRDAPRE